MAIKPKTFDDIRLQQETIRNMQRKQVAKKPRLTSKTLAPMSRNAIQARRTQIKKPKLKNPAGGTKNSDPPKVPKLKSQTRAPMSQSVINNRRNELKKPQLSDKTKAPMSGEAINNRRKQLKKPKLNLGTRLVHNTTLVYSVAFKQLRKFNLKNPAGGLKGGMPKKKPQLKPATKKPMNPLVIKDRKNKLKKPKLKNPAGGVKGGPPNKKPQLKPATKKPMNPLVINDRKNKLKKPKLANETKKPMSTAEIKGRKEKLKKPALKSKTTANAAKEGSQKYPPIGFFFKVEVKGFRADVKFKEVSGLTAEREFETIIEGGNNDFAYKVPKGPTKYSNLVLKRGLLPAKSQLAKWCLNSNIQSLMNKPIKPKDISIQLLDAHAGSESPIMTWSLTQAWPIKWEVTGFDAQKSEVVIESIEFAYQKFTVS